MTATLLTCLCACNKTGKFDENKNISIVTRTDGSGTKSAIMEFLGLKGKKDVSGAIVCGGMGRERNLIVDKRQTNLTPTTHIKGEINKDGIRKMTPREWARLQGFPDDYKLVLADVHLYKQFGNSVTVPVIQAIAEKIKEVLDKNGRD